MGSFVTAFFPFCCSWVGLVHFLVLKFLIPGVCVYKCWSRIFTSLQSIVLQFSSLMIAYLVRISYQLRRLYLHFHVVFFLYRSFIGSLIFSQFLDVSWADYDLKSTLACLLCEIVFCKHLMMVVERGRRKDWIRLPLVCFPVCWILNVPFFLLYSPCCVSEGHNLCSVEFSPGEMTLA